MSGERLLASPNEQNRGGSFKMLNQGGAKRKICSIPHAQKHFLGLFRKLIDSANMGGKEKFIV